MKATRIVAGLLAMLVVPAALTAAESAASSPASISKRANWSSTR